MASKKASIASTSPSADQEQLEFELPLSDQYLIRLHAEQIRLACRAYCVGRIAAVAKDLDNIFGESLGHPVSESTLRVALDGSERNYWRGEWLPYFAARCPQVAALLVQTAPVQLSADQVLAILDELAPQECGASYTRLRARMKRLGK